MAHIVIIGNGISGSTAALDIRERSNHDITMISEECLQPYARTALMYIFMGHLKKEHTELHPARFWTEKRINRIQAVVNSVDTIGKCVNLDNGNAVYYDKLIVASGSKPNRLGCPGEQLDAVGGLYYLQDLVLMERFSVDLKRAVVVGGGLIGVEMAEMLASRNIPVTFLVRESSFCNYFLPEEESKMVTRHLIEHGIDIRLNTELTEIEGDENGRACAVIDSHNQKTTCGFVGITTGVSPNLPVFYPADAVAVNRGILVDEYLNSTSSELFAIGDCAELSKVKEGRKAVEAVWYTAKMMGHTVAKTICGEMTPYKQRTWYNSAKFFDIEHQMYGKVPIRDDETTESLYWEHPSGKKSLRICFETSGEMPVIGFNLMGVRYRQEVCIRWIEEKKSLKMVLLDLRQANFDPEFYNSFEDEIINLYIEKFRPETRLENNRRKSQFEKITALFSTIRK